MRVTDVFSNSKITDLTERYFLGKDYVVELVILHFNS